jgi:3-phosphoshikimate 1-carboxyvinyltransferase
MTHAYAPVPLTARKSAPLKGTAKIPGDKSISHRALMFGGLAVGETVITGLLEGEDVLNTAAAMRAMGARIEKAPDGLWRCHGVGVGGLHEPACVLDMGNSGTSTRLLMGLVAGHPMTAIFTGDASLIKRPMARVMKPLEMMGAQFMAREGGRLPLAVRGTASVLPIEYRLPVASAQVKSAIMLAGLSARGITTVIEDKPTRDHSENMLRHFGVNVDVEDLTGGAQAVRVTGQMDMRGANVTVPADPSSAAFAVVAALITPGSELRLPNIGMNPRRTGIYTTLIEMGADIRFENRRIQGGEPVADIVVTGNNKLKGVHVPAERAPSMIDEYPVLSAAAACADGKTYMPGLEELRVKESDRLLMIAEGLKACGVSLEMGEADLTVHGTGQPPVGGAMIATALDHRIAMSFLVLGGVTANPVTVDDGSPIATSFPTFLNLMTSLGADIG